VKRAGPGGTVAATVPRDRLWLAQTPQERLSALVAIRRDVDKVLAARDRGMVE